MTSMKNSWRGETAAAAAAAAAAVVVTWSQRAVARDAGVQRRVSHEHSAHADDTCLSTHPGTPPCLSSASSPDITSSTY